MALNNLFGGRGRSSNQPKNAVEFRAGKMTLKGNMVHPDKRKGQVYVYQSEDGLTHFCWKDRTSGVVEDDLIIFPEDAIFSKVTQCKDDSRVFLLKFKNSSRKLFYWMQEPKTDMDADLVFKVNDSINNPGGGSGGSRGTTSATTPTASEQEMHTLLQSMSQAQLMQLLGGMNDLEGASSLLSQMGLGQLGGGGGGLGGESRSTSSNGGGSSAGGGVTTLTGNSTAGEALPKTTTNTTTTNSSSKKEDTSSASKSGASSSSSSSSSKPPVQLQDLQKILSGMQPPPAVDLSAGVNSEFVKRITSCPTTIQKLTPLLPKFGFSGTIADSKESDPQDVVDTLISPAFTHALSSFCSAFPSGQLGPLVEQFQFGKDAIQAAQSGNLEAFLTAIQKEADNKPKESSSEKPEDMNVD